MNTLRSYIASNFVSGQGPLTPLYNPSTEEALWQTGTSGLDLGAVVPWARKGRPALSMMTFAARGAMIMAASKALHGVRDELLSLAMTSGGNTRGDAKFDVDGAIGTLAAYAELGARLGDTHHLRDGEGAQPTRSTKLWGEHLWLPRQGVALHINAFNFPAWGLCEKAAVAWLCGMPVISKPATSTAPVACRIAEVLIDSGVLPQGALQLIAGGLGDLLAHLGDQDVIAFTGSSDTAKILRKSDAVIERGTRLNVEADSLNAAVLGPDGECGGELYDLFMADVVKDITQKTGQKCTAIRRVFVPADRLDELSAELAERLAGMRVGNPIEDAVQVGPVATAAQLASVRQGIATLLSAPSARLVCGGPEPVDGLGAPKGKGYFVRPTLLRCDDALRADAIHDHEVFGPVATIMPYRDGAELCALLARGRGGLVASLYSDDRALVQQVVFGGGPFHGRIFVGSARLSGQSPGPGTALPHLNHGGPGRAGDGHELGGVRGMEFYMQRCAVAGYRPVIESLLPGQPAR